MEEVLCNFCGDPGGGNPVFHPEGQSCFNDLKTLRVIEEEEEEKSVPENGIPGIVTQLVEHGAEPRFAAVIGDICRLAISKGHDYSPGADPYANARASEQFGVPGWVGVAIRMGDKMRRLESFSKQGLLIHESASDSFLDLAVYGIIGKILLDEEGTA